MSIKEVRRKYEKVRAALDDLYWAIDRLDRLLQKTRDREDSEIKG